MILEPFVLVGGTPSDLNVNASNGRGCSYICYRVWNGFSGSIPHAAGRILRWLGRMCFSKTWTEIQIDFHSSVPAGQPLSWNLLQSGLWDLNMKSLWIVGLICILFDHSVRCPPLPSPSPSSSSLHFPSLPFSLSLSLSCFISIVPRVVQCNFLSAY